MWPHQPRRIDRCKVGYELCRTNHLITKMGSCHFHRDRRSAVRIPFSYYTLALSVHSFRKPGPGYCDHHCVLQSPSTCPSSHPRHFLELPMLEPLFPRSISRADKCSTQSQTLSPAFLVTRLTWSFRTLLHPITRHTRSQNYASATSINDRSARQSLVGKSMD